MRLGLSARQPVTSVVIRNDGAEATVVQLEVVSWSQTDKDDVYAQTAEVLATPPIFTVPSGGSQVVRLGLRRPPDAQHELTYRLFMQEVPPPPAPGSQGLRMALRVGVPVFVAATVKTRPELTWRTSDAGDGSIRISVANSGTEHVKIADVELTVLDGERETRARQVATYVLPGQHRDWVVKMQTPVNTGTALHVRAHTDASAELDAHLTLDAT